MRLSPGSQVEDRYVVEGRIGSGGMADVYRMRHGSLGSLHALKLLTHTSPGVARRLLLEGKAQGRLRHPNVLGVSDLVTVAGTPALVMEYVAGPSLDVLLERRRLSIDEADLLARGLLEGMAAAHAAGLVHRDLKPANVLLAPGPGRVIPKVADFGLVKGGRELESSVLTRTGAVMGTPAYMAPEQIRDSAAVDGRADVWSLGVVLHEVLSGQRAFQGRDTFELYELIAYGRCASLREVCPGLPDRMLRAVEGALRVSADERWPHAGAMLEAWLGEPPASAPPWPPDLVAEVAALAPPLDVTDHGPRSQETLASDVFEVPSHPPPRPHAVTAPTKAPLAEAAAPTGSPITAVALAGLVAGLLGALGLAPTMLAAAFEDTLQAPVELPSWTRVAGLLLAVLGPTVSAGLAVRRSDQGPGAGAAIGLLAGLLASALATGPATAIQSAGSLLQAVATRTAHEGEALAAVVGRSVVEIMWGTSGAYLGTVAGFVFLGVIGGVLARIGVERPPRPLAHAEVRGIGGLGISVSLAASVVIIAVMTALSELEAQLQEIAGLPGFVSSLTVLPMAYAVPWLALGGALTLWGASRDLAYRGPGRHRPAARARMFLTWLVLAAVIGLIASLSPAVASSGPFVLGMAAVALTWGAATVAAVSWAGRNVLVEPALPSPGTIAGLGLVEAILVPGMTWGTAISGGLGAGLFTVAYVEALSEGLAGPPPADQGWLLLKLHLAVLPVVLLTFLVGQAWSQPLGWLRRRAWRRMSAPRA